MTGPLCLQALFRIRQCFLVLQSAVSDSPSVSANHVQNQCFLVLQNAGSDSPSVPVQLLTARNIQRPQLSFRDKIDNSNNPFVPVIAFKPHALKSLQGQHLMTDFEWTV